MEQLPEITDSTYQENHACDAYCNPSLIDDMVTKKLLNEIRQ